MCGDNASSSRCIELSDGSPPRVWGQPTHTHPSYVQIRFTPTCVGTTSLEASYIRCLPVHPHVCGDNHKRSRGATLKPGSPPRVWGQRPPYCNQHTPLRFTPTCVGTTVCAVRYSGCYSVHPHVCGDNKRDVADRIWADGSPPRVWGQRSYSSKPLGRKRFTPTCVGTTTHQVITIRLTAVHPHVCGDNVPYLPEIVGLTGSPPRVWGQPRRWRLKRAATRFTPTCVGTTPCCLLPISSAAVHPHVCGDNLFRSGRGLGRFGSPPRVWGQPDQDRRILSV